LKGSISISGEESAVDLLCTVPESLLREVVEVFGEQAWGRLTALEKMGRVFNFIIKMNDTKSVLYGQVQNPLNPKP
jgi:hypothetical protein